MRRGHWAQMKCGHARLGENKASQIMEGDGEAWSWPEGRVTQPHEQVKGETGKGQGMVPDKVTVSWWRSFFRK